MLLVYQAGSVKVGEVVRYTLTYTPADDRIIPSPSHLHVRIKNASAIPLRAAYLHGPYTIHCSAYPSTFNPNQKVEDPKRDGVPQFEPNLKAGGHWYARLAIPDDVRQSGDSDVSPSSGSVTWIIEVASQILFSGTATVHYEILVGRDERSLDLGFAAVAGKGHGEPGQLQDHVQDQHHHRRQPKGVYSSAVNLVVEDTNRLWDKPHLPSRKPIIEKAQHLHHAKHPQNEGQTKKQKKKQKQRIHLVVLTHGLHSNIGADMLYLKESIDATVKRAREEEREKRKQQKAQKQGNSAAQEQQDTEQKSHESDSSSKKKVDNKEEPTSTAPLSGGQEDLDESEQDLGEEQVVVRGFSGNTVRTEKGIQYLGKRLAKFVLTTTYPDQPYLPQSKSLTRQVTETLSLGSKEGPLPGDPAHPNSTVLKTTPPDTDLPYTFTSISFIGHSLGGLIQMYAIAYIQKHSPEFFQQIKPVNFVAMASPFLGLSNENPMYVKFALDFGLVGRTGQDLGLTWRPPTVARSGWNALLSGLGSGGHESQPQEDPRAKPLLRILPTGPAHKVLKMFRNRTVYSNVVNDGVVPLRTSCLLFLDWRGLGKVENAQRGNGLLATLANFGWNELTGANSSTNITSHSPGSKRNDDGQISEDDSDESASERTRRAKLQAQADAEVSASPLGIPTAFDPSTGSSTPTENQWLDQSHPHTSHGKSSSSSSTHQTPQESGPLAEFLNFFRPSSRGSPARQPEKRSRKTQKTFHRAQTVRHDSSNREEHSAPPASDSAVRPNATRGDSLLGDVSAGGPPPKTSIFEAAGDIINPPLPAESWLIDPSSRSRTIFHDRIYHPEDIPPPQPRHSRVGRSLSADGTSDRSKTFPSFSISPSRNKVRSRDGTSISSEASDGDGTSGMRVEEKIAREYHRDLSWRKVLVRLEPDAHNNMIVRRMFANAYGWDVVKHLCDTHFAKTYSAETADEDEPNTERVPGGTDGKQHPPTESGEEVIGQTETHKEHRDRTTSEAAEGADALAELKKPPILQNTSSVGLASNHAIQKSETIGVGARDLTAARGRSIDSSVWDDRMFDGTDVSETDDDDDDDGGAPSAAASGPFAQIQRFLQNHGINAPDAKKAQQQQQQPPSLSVTPGHGKASVSQNAKPPTDAEIAETLTKSPVDAAEDGGAGVLEQLNRELSRHDSIKESQGRSRK